MLKTTRPCQKFRACGADTPVCRAEARLGAFRPPQHHAFATLSLLFLSLSASSLPAAEETTPAWLQQAIATPVPSYDAKVPGVYLLRDHYVTLEPSGRLTSTVRIIYKILTREGRPEAVGSHLYLAGTDKVRELKAWMLSPSGELLKLGKELSYDRAYISNDLYDDLRVRGIDARSKADPGSIFAFEAVIDELAFFNQFEWSFQNREPVVLSRYILTLPAGWRATSTTFNHPVIEPSVDGSTYTWTARDLPFVEPEPSSPNLSSMVPRLALSFFPSDGPPFSGRSLKNWQDVSLWINELSAAQAEPDEDVTAKARQLTANSQTEMERIRAIARYVQSTKYVSIQLGVGKGGGYRPRPAADTLSKEYGDCKDKATLMRALLKAIGIPSYLILVSANDRSYVHEDFPSPRQFNHAIVGIRLAADAATSPQIEPPGLGRLLLFDPTSGSTPVGDLPTSEQGGFGLIVAPEHGELVRLPFQPAPSSATEREIRASLDQDGTLTAKVSDTAIGQHAALDRASVNSQGDAGFQKVIERWVSLGATGAHIDKIDHQDHFSEGRFNLQTEFVAPAYAQIRSNHLMIFRPAIVGRRQAVFLTDSKRTQPVLLNPTRFHETVHLKLPANFKVDELPDAENFETPFGRYSALCQVKDNELLFTRTLEIRPVSVPVAQYQALREFYERILTVEQTPVVLARQ
jgi:hypothetical protein